MRLKNNLLVVLSFLIAYLLPQRACLAQIEEEKEERKAQMQMLQKKPAGYKLSSSVALFSGYDNNVKLIPNRKGSGFQETLYSLDFSKPLGQGWGLNLYYDLDYLNYNDSTDSSNLMNHLRVDLNKKLNRFFTIGGGYDFSDFYYPDNKDGDFLFHKGFLYVNHYISRNIFHRLGFEYGYKWHISKNALSDTITTLQDEELVDKRQSVEYTLGSNLSPSLYAQLKYRFSNNDSNARFIDFYDYKSWELGPFINYKFSESMNIIGSFNYLRKVYDERTITTGTEKEKDNVYAVNAGIKYKLNKNQTVSLFYTYRDNSTNEPLEKYNENVFTCGWQYNF